MQASPSPVAVLVDTEALANSPSWRVFDCRHDLAQPEAGAAAYAQGHIPGALHAHLDRALSGPKTGRNGRHPLPDPAALLAWLGEAGLQPDDHVVAYDDAGGMYAARLWWLLHWIGHRAVSVLDGGWSAWVREGGATTTETPAFAPTRFSGTADAGAWVDAGFVRTNLATRLATLVDARGAGRYAGEGETIDPVGGHIPGALNRPYLDNLGAQGRFKPAAQLRAEWLAVLQQAGRIDASGLVAQCGSGVTACHNLLALERAGLPGARLYPGSWSEWCSDPTRPVARGAEAFGTPRPHHRTP